MKIIKKGIALTLALLMILAIGISASAADAPTKGSITIQKPTKTEYPYYEEDFPHLYRIFDATVAFDDNGAPTGAINYTCTEAQKAVLEGSDYFEVDDANNVSAKEAAIVVNEETGEVSLSARAVQWIKAHIADPVNPLGTLVNLSEWSSSNVEPCYRDNYNAEGGYQRGVRTFYNLPFGYYYIDSTVGSAVMIDSAKPKANIVDKNGVPSMTKIISDITNCNGEHPGNIYDNGDNAEAQIGDTVTYTVTVTAMPGAEQYILSDAMNWGLTLDPESISIKVGPPDEDPDAYPPLGTDNYMLLTDTGTGYTFREADTEQGVPAAIGKWEGDTFTPNYVFPEGFSDDIKLAKGVNSNSDYSEFWDPYNNNDYHNYTTHYQYADYSTYGFYGGASRFWPDPEYLNTLNIPDDYGAQIVVLFDQAYLDTITEATNIVLTYNATPNATLTETYYQPIRNNTAVLNYGHSYALHDRTSLISWQLVVYKYEGDGESIIPVVDDTDPTGDGSGSGSGATSYVEATPLDGVKFMLKRADGKYLKYILLDQNDPNSLAITWVDIKDAQPTELVTGPCNIWGIDENGHYGPLTMKERHGYIVVDGLVPGTYTLEETAPKPGYNKAQPTTFSLPPESAFLGYWNPDVNWRYQVDIPNKPGTVLPETGGSGTAIYYLLGFTVLLSGAAVLLRRREKAAGAQ